MKVAIGHLTTGDKRIVLGMLKNGMLKGQVKKDIYTISPITRDLIDVTILKWDKGIIPVPGSGYRHTIYESRIRLSDSELQNLKK